MQTSESLLKKSGRTSQQVEYLKMFDMVELVKATLRDLGPDWSVRMTANGSIALINKETGEIHVVIAADEGDEDEGS